jgi:hypothetical protein
VGALLLDREISLFGRFEVFTVVTMKNTVPGMSCHAALVRTDVSGECITSIIRIPRISELETLAVTSNRRKLQRNTSTNAVPSSPILVTFMMEAIVPPKRWFLKESHGINIPEDGILQSFFGVKGLWVFKV